MSKKDYISAARLIRELKSCDDKTRAEGWFIKFFSMDNPRFDSKLFYNAIYGNGENNE